MEGSYVFGRAKALERLDGLQLQIARHLVLLFAMPESPDATGWLNELKAWRQELSALNRGKKGTDNLKFSTLKKALWEEPFEEPGDRAQRIREIYQNKGILISSLEDRVPALKDFVFKFISAVQSGTDFS